MIRAQEAPQDFVLFAPPKEPPPPGSFSNVGAVAPITVEDLQRVIDSIKKRRGEP
jgi:hypothetical protein